MTTETVPSGARRIEWTFADRVRKIRRELGMSQGAFAASIGQKPGPLGHWESGRNKPEDLVAVAKMIERVHHVPAAWTLGIEIDTTGGPQGPQGLVTSSYSARREVLSLNSLLRRPRTVTASRGKSTNNPQRQPVSSNVELLPAAA